MNLTLDVLLVVIPPLLIIEGFFSGSEIALLSLDPMKLKQRAHDGNRGARLALDLVKYPERVLSTTLVMTSLCMIAISSLIAIYCIEHWGSERGDWIAIAIASPLVVLLGELLPKTLYQRYSQIIAPICAYGVVITYYVFYPVTRLLSLYTNRVSRMVAPLEELIAGKKRTTREELVSMLSYGKRESELKSSERKMIKRILDFKDSEAKHALIPLVKIEAIEDSSTVKDALERFEKHRHSRMPVFSDRIDNIVGVLEVSNLFSASDTQASIKGFLSAPHYVPETQALDDLLLEMRREDLELVIVVDEYGGAIGILTLEDIVEEIVGEIQDEYDSESMLYRQISDTSWMIQGRAQIDLLNDQLKLDLPQGEYETLSGFLLQQFARIPEVQDELYFDTSVGTLKLVIARATERRIESVQVELIARPKE